MKAAVLLSTWSSCTRLARVWPTIDTAHYATIIYEWVLRGGMLTYSTQDNETLFLSQLTGSRLGTYKSSTSEDGF